MKLTFNETTYEFKMIAHRLHIYVNSQLTKISDEQDPRSIGPQSIHDCVDLIDYYEL